MTDNQPRYTTKRLHDEIAKARDYERSESQARITELEAQVAFTLSDASRLLRKQDAQGACPHPDDCFYQSDRVRCGPCAVKASAAKGIEIDDTHSHLPEVCRLRREVKSAQARIAELEADPARQTKANVDDLTRRLLDVLDNEEELSDEVLEAFKALDNAVSAQPPSPHLRASILEEAAKVAETGDYYGQFQTAGDERRAKAIAERIRALATTSPETKLRGEE